MKKKNSKSLNGRRFMSAFMFAALAAGVTGCSGESSSEPVETKPQIIAEHEVIGGAGDKETTLETEESTTGTGDGREKPTISKNVDYDLSVVNIGGMDYDLSETSYRSLLEGTGTKEAGYITLAYDTSAFKASLSGYGIFADDDPYGTVFCLELEKDGEPVSYASDLTEGEDADISCFAAYESGDDFDITFAGGLVFEQEMPLEDVTAVLGEGTEIDDGAYIGYCDGDYMLLIDLYAFDNVVENILVYPCSEYAYVQY
jgi:hypothetical protein